ncbi:MAG TPA: hypothetical protein PK919_07165 [Candidatus Aminicenantes bacterium]|nr:hypothetical protein [Candidatus Aminicenantes bacterium]
MRKRIWLLAAAALMLCADACVKLKHEMVIQPVHITVDVLIKIDRELQDFFGDIDQATAPAKNDAAARQEEVK